MIKRYRYIAILTLVFLGIFLFLKREYFKPAPQVSQSTPKTMRKEPAKKNAEPPLLKGKRVVGLSPGKEKEQLKSLKVMNSPSTSWEAGLEETLRYQGGKALKEVTFHKVDSFVWAQDGIALFVESVIVTLKNDKNVQTTFRVLVDAQSGKILKNWDQPVFDPVNPRDNFKIKIDPRYHTE